MGTASIRIRPAASSEYPVVAEAEQRLFGEHGFSLRQVRYYGQRERAFVLVATGRDGAVAGYAIGAVNRTGGRPVLWLMSIAVEPSQRRKGVGRALMRAALRAGQKHGAHEAKLQVRPVNRAAVALYRSFGFVGGRRLPAYYGRNGDAVLMQRSAEATP